ncbi:MAG: zinc ribbon domain-containing protein [Dehalococcoidales bacterium]|nr:zinc ribbon domain-containing protein [Dehalococcoidales bacterium]
MKITKYIILLFTLVGLVWSGAGKSTVMAAGESVKYKNVHIWVNPEYDNPRLLVMMQGQLDGVTAPATVTFLVPTTAEMYSAGSIDADGKYTGGPPDRVASSVSGWDQISYTVNSDTFRVEYYDAIIQGLPDKTIDYQFRTLNPISQLTFLIQEPLKSGNYTVVPAGNVSRDSENFTIHTYSYPTIDSQSPLEFKITYTKADNIPSLTGATTTAATAGTSGGSTSPLLFVIPFVLIIGVIGVLWYSTNQKKHRKKAAPQPVKAKAANGTTGTKPKNIFCPECGEPNPGTKFCPNCGTKL